MFQAYEDAGIRALVGFGMMDRPLVDSLPFVDELVPAALAAELLAAPRTPTADFDALMRELATARHRRASRVGVLVSVSAPQRCSGGFLVAMRALGLVDRYREAEASAAPKLAAVEAIYRRSLALPIPAATLPAKLD